MAHDPHNLPPWYTVYQQAQRWIEAGVLEDMVHDLRALLRLAKAKEEQPTAAIFDGRTVPSTPESGDRAGYDGYKRKKGSKIHVAVDTLGLLLASHVTPANEQERAQVKELAEAVQEVTQNSVEVAYVDQEYTREDPKNDAEAVGIKLIVVKLPEAKKGFVLLPRRWVVEGSFAWTTRFRRLARGFERLPETFRSLHFLAFAILMLHNFVKTIAHLL
jgi:transposase